jgi:glucose uptake protein GlcU
MHNMQTIVIIIIGFILAMTLIVIGCATGTRQDEQEEREVEFLKDEQRRKNILNAFRNKYRGGRY